MSLQLKIFRITKGLKAKDLAKRAGITSTYLSLIETGKAFPSSKVQSRLARTLGFSKKALFNNGR